MTFIDLTAHKEVASLAEDHKAKWGQFFTPPSIARFMANLLAPGTAPIRLLDPGAGAGSLTGAFLDMLQERSNLDQFVELTAYELDSTLLPQLAATINSDRPGLTVKANILSQDFIESAVTQLQFCPSDRYTHAILNPPYQKIAANSRQRRLLRQAGVETVNLYAAFVALAIALLQPGGQLVAITPRSFCNGPYFRSFRKYILDTCAVNHIHLFEARDKAFGADGVLQENIIILLAKGVNQGSVTISTSDDHNFHNYSEVVYPFEQIVLEDDPEEFIHIPMSGTAGSNDRPQRFSCSLKDLAIQVSTGPVVDFRLQEHLRVLPEAGTAPLFYPSHFVAHAVKWPLASSKKPNAIVVRAETTSWLYPTGFYTVVRRFSSKEEKRRIVASLVMPEQAYGPLLGFENHLNVFHLDKAGLPEMLARGLMVYLNSTQVDHVFRQFSGHTQVNATDLRNMTYPHRDSLIRLGSYSKDKLLSQDEIDQLVESLE